MRVTQCSLEIRDNNQNTKMYNTCNLSVIRSVLGPQGFGGSEENGYLFSGSWEALVITFRDLGSKLIVWGIKGALQKSKTNSP